MTNMALDSAACDEGIAYRRRDAMKKLVILGAGTAGTMVANRLSRMLDGDEWRITIVDQTPGLHEDEWHKSIYDFYTF